jgi:hypothetical protein
MATFRLRVRPGTGVDISDPNANAVDVPGATFLFVDRLLEDAHGNLRGTVTFRGVITKSSQPMTSRSHSTPPTNWTRV